MAVWKKLPMGIEQFEEIRRDGYYYVDKTGLIRVLMENGGKANLFTRPRRFGKSLNMSMLRSFFEIGCDGKLFDGLEIAGEKELCEKYMGKYPVISISLKGVEAENWEEARDMIAEVIREEARRFQFLFDSDRLTEIDKEFFSLLLKARMSDQSLKSSLRELSLLLCRHYGQQVIILIDEYDVPLAKANERGYYDRMALLIRNMFEAALKTNDNLHFAVLTGCLRVAKESIFTGLNNFSVFSITDMDFDECFGFTDSEVKEMLDYYGLEENYGIVKEWYDGYRFGRTQIYCPWDVICYCSKNRNHKNLPPQNYWLNTSGNEMLKHFIEGAAAGTGLRTITRTEIERLVDGAEVQKEIHQELTYPELYAAADNIRSALFMTGYLTWRGEPDGNRYRLVIPNREVRNIFTEQILAMFKEKTAKDGTLLNAFCSALAEGRPKEVERLFTSYMEKTVSIRDTFVRKPTKENFYHGMLLGILGFKEGWTVTSNKEAGDGFSDIMIRIDDADIGIIIEVKYADTGAETECRKALRQIDEKGYAKELQKEGIAVVLKYAIVCGRKRCQVLLETTG